MKRICLLLLLLGCWVNTQAQTQIIYQSTETKSWLLSYMQNSGEESQRVINEMLEAISTYIPKPVYQTKITFNVEENIRITRDRNVVNMFVAHQNISLNGDVFYKGFDMTDVIIPTKYDFAASLYRSKGGEFLANFTQQKSNFVVPYSEVLFKYNDTAAVSSYYLVLTSTTFYYDNNSRTRFRDKVTLIDQYYLAENDLKKIDAQLNNIDPDAFEVINSTQEYLNNARKSLDNISGAAFWQALRIENYDPIKLYPRLYAVNAHCRDLQTQLSYTQSVIHQLYYDKALKLYNSKKLNDARINFEKSLSYSPMYGPSQYYLVLIAFEEKRLDDAKLQMKKLFSFKDLDNQIRDAAYQLCKAIEWTDINTAAGYLNESKYGDALTSAQKAEDFCKSIPAYTCNDTIELIRKDAHYGLYNQYVVKAQQNFTLKKYDDAERDANLAVEYQKAHTAYVPDNKAALEIYSKVMVEQYSIAVKRGQDYMETKDYRAAFNQFSKATELESGFPVRKDRQLPNLLKSSKTEVLLLDLKDAEKAVGQNDLTRAREILRNVIEEQKAYDLLTITRLNNSIESLKKSIFSQECENAQKLYDEQISDANGLVESKDFIAAETNFQEALKTTQNNRDCGINADLSINGKKSMEKPAQYQRTLNKIKDYISSSLYEKAITEYNLLTAYYTNNLLNAYGITHLPLHEFICANRFEFSLYGITYMINTNELDLGLYLLRHLRTINLAAKITLSQQTSLARSLALRDFKADPSVNGKLKVAEYTLNDKWYKYFTKEYLKQLKKIQ